MKKKKTETECEESTKHSLFTQSTKHGVWCKRIVLLGSSFILNLMHQGGTFSGSCFAKHKLNIDLS